MELEILGSGTSHGIPVIGCDCPVCRSEDTRDNRTRASALFRGDSGESVLVDAGPEFRVQAIRARITRLDAVLVTHTHADHVHGFDDLRIFSYERRLPVYASAADIAEIRERFSYAFRPTQEGGGKPRLDLIAVDGPVRVGDLEFIPIPLLHGELPVLGWRCGDIAYLTDASAIPESSFALLEGTKRLVIDALRLRSHPTHFNFRDALAAIERIAPDKAWFTHLCHDFSHEGIMDWLRTNAPGKKIEPVYDGLRISADGRD